jgi:hypothetical protein
MNWRVACLDRQNNDQYYLLSRLLLSYLGISLAYSVQQVTEAGLVIDELCLADTVVIKCQFMFTRTYTDMGNCKTVIVTVQTHTWSRVLGGNTGRSLAKGKK